jgi:hypothetical protein
MTRVSLYALTFWSFSFTPRIGGDGKHHDYTAFHLMNVLRCVLVLVLVVEGLISLLSFSAVQKPCRPEPARRSDFEV